VAFAAIVAVSLLAPPPWAKVTAVLAFLYLPLAAMRGTGEDARDYGSDAGCAGARLSCSPVRLLA
jgi:hypothetical protein